MSRVNETYGSNPKFRSLILAESRDLLPLSFGSFVVEVLVILVFAVVLNLTANKVPERLHGPVLRWGWFAILFYFTFSFMRIDFIRRYAVLALGSKWWSYVVCGLLGAAVAIVYWAIVNAAVTQLSPSPAATSASPPNVPTPLIKRVLLTPGDHQTPPGPACTGDMETPLEVAKGMIAVFFASSIATTNGAGTSIVSFDGQSVLSFRRVTGEMYLDAIIRDAPGHEVGRIEGNVVTLKANGYDVLNPDSHNLVVLDADGNRVLSVRYVNESAMIVSGRFFGESRGPVWVKEDGNIEGDVNNAIRAIYTENCFADFHGPLFKF